MTRSKMNEYRKNEEQLKKVEKTDHFTTSPGESPGFARVNAIRRQSRIQEQ